MCSCSNKIRHIVCLGFEPAKLSREIENPTNGYHGNQTFL